MNRKCKIGKRFYTARMSTFLYTIFLRSCVCAILRIAFLDYLYVVAGKRLGCVKVHRQNVHMGKCGKMSAFVSPDVLHTCITKCLSQHVGLFYFFTLSVIQPLFGCFFLFLF